MPAVEAPVKPSIPVREEPVFPDIVPGEPRTEPSIAPPPPPPPPNKPTRRMPSPNWS